MGAWGAGSFDNDTALDFVSGIGSVADVEKAFQASSELGVAKIEGEIDADLSCEIIVAAECVAAMRGHASPDMPEELSERVQSFGTPSMDLFELARNNVSAVMSRSELCELWADEGSGDWNRAMTGLIDRLNQPEAKAKGAKKKKAKKPQPNPSPCMFCDKPMGDEQFHMFDLTIHEDEISTSKRGGWVHLECLNAALHPRHMIQNWEYSDEQLDWLREKLKA